MNKLTAIMRSKSENLSILRSKGMVPGVVYGAQVENTPISVSSSSFAKILKISGETSTIILEIESIDEKKKSLKVDVLIHEVQVHPVKGFTTHVDFLAVDMNKPVEVTIPLDFIGVAKAETDGLGSLSKVLHEIDVRALPKDLPNKIEVDVTKILTLEDIIHANDIILPNGVTLITEGDDVVVLVSALKEEVEEKIEEEVDLSSIEVEKKGKKDDDIKEETPSDKE